jgi:DNA-binding transcriptional MocR family regulator
MTVHYIPEGTTARELVASVEQAVRRGVLRPGDALPPVRVLAAERSMSPTTVAAAYRVLGTRGVVVGKGRAGTRVAGAPPVAAPLPVHVPRGAVDLMSGGPDPELLPPLPRLTGRAARYGQAAVLPELHQVATATLLAEGIDAAHLAVVGGALDGVERVLGAWTGPGARVAVEDPGYAPLLRLLAAMRLVPVPVPVDDFGARPDSLAHALASGCDAVVLTPRAENPTGGAWDEERRAALAAVLADHPHPVVVEDDHAGPVAGVPTVTACAGRTRWATVRSVSKWLGPDYRLAVLVGDEATVGRVAGRQALATGWVSHLIQRAVATLWGDPDTDRRLERATAVYAERRAALRRSLNDAGIAATGRSGFTTWVPVHDEHAVTTGLAERGWAVLPGAGFRVDAGPGVRIAFPTLPAERAPDLAADLRAVLHGQPVRST